MQKTHKRFSIFSLDLDLDLDFFYWTILFPAQLQKI